MCISITNIQTHGSLFFRINCSPQYICTGSHTSSDWLTDWKKPGFQLFLQEMAVTTALCIHNILLHCALDCALFTCSGAACQSYHHQLSFIIISLWLLFFILFLLPQRNVAGSSPAMEYLAFQNCMQYLLGCGLPIGALITDRHMSIAKHMREQLPQITHYFDLWNLKKSKGLPIHKLFIWKKKWFEYQFFQTEIHKVLLKISKERNGEVLRNWIKPCTNHLMWSTISTLSSNGSVIWAKFRSFLGHFIDKHNHDDHNSTSVPMTVISKTGHGLMKVTSSKIISTWPGHEFNSPLTPLFFFSECVYFLKVFHKCPE